MVEVLPPDRVSVMRDRCAAEGGIFWIGPDELAVLDADAAQQVTAANYADLTLPDALGDVLRRRRSTPVSWATVRLAWTAQLRRLAEAAAVEQLDRRIEAHLDRHRDTPVDVLPYTLDLGVTALVPVVIADLAAPAAARVARDIAVKFDLLTSRDAHLSRAWRSARLFLTQVRAGTAVRREIRDRARGTRPRRTDLLDPIVDLLPVLGIDRAVDAVTTVLTALVGSPIPVSACLLYELSHRPDWAERIGAELAGVALPALYAAPTTAAPLTHRFVKEVLRLWGGPSLFIRDVRADIALPAAQLRIGQRYRVSTYMVHHDPRYWADPFTFDPDRWLPGAANAPGDGPCYVPFGWQPRACIAARLGLTYLTLLCRQSTTAFRLTATAPDRRRIVETDAPIPVGFEVRIQRRS